VKSLPSSGSILLPTVQGASRSLLILLLSFLFLLTTPNLLAIHDTNQNGVSDLWEKKYNQGALYPTFTPTADPDGDGWTNLQEAAAGTDPANGKSPTGIVRPELTRTPAVYLSPATPGGPPQLLTPEVATITWPTVAGKQYTLLFSTDLAAGNWTAIGSPRIGESTEIGTSIPLTQPDGSTPGALFWRVTIADEDTDSDTLTNAEEAELGSRPYSSDGDNDGLSDIAELFTYHTNSNSPDTDGDGITDGDEIASDHDPLSNQSYPPRWNIALRTAHNGASGTKGRLISNWPPYFSQEIRYESIRVSTFSTWLATRPFPEQAPDNLLLPYENSRHWGGFTPSYRLVGIDAFGSLTQGRYWLQTKPASNVEIKRTFLKVTSSWRSTYSPVAEVFPPIVEKLEVTIPANSTASPHIDIMPPLNFPPGFYYYIDKEISLIPLDLDIVHPASGEVAEGSEDSSSAYVEKGRGGLVAIRRNSDTPLTKLVLRAVPGLTTTSKFRLNVESTLRSGHIKIWKDQACTQLVTSQQTEFDVGVETTLYLEGVDHGSVGDLKIIQEIKVGETWHQGDKVSIAVVHAEIEVVLRCFIPHKWTDSEPPLPIPVAIILVGIPPLPFVETSSTIAGDRQPYSVENYADEPLFRLSQMIVMTPYKELHGQVDITSKRDEKAAPLTEYYRKSEDIPAADQHADFGETLAVGAAPNWFFPPNPNPTANYTKAHRSGDVSKITGGFRLLANKS
jgi:Bacterial TSP3 repeat